MKKLIPLHITALIISLTSLSSLNAQTALVGMAYGGGNQYGTIFGISPGSTSLQQQLAIPGAPGSNPFRTHLIEATNGKFYGMTLNGGTSGDGVIFEYDPAINTYTKKFDFSPAQGNNPYGSLVQASNGKLYGMTYGGGASNEGVIFEYDFTTNSYTKKLDLTTSTGSNPEGSLIQAANGKLYGLTNEGGANNYGVIFEYDYVTNTYTSKFDFAFNTGNRPTGSLVQAVNGKLYGMTHSGGPSNNSGTIFEFDYTAGTYTDKFNFSYFNTGRKPIGSLIQASNGNLYGMTTQGGSSDMGVIFEYNYTTDTYTKKIDLTTSMGSFPWGSLIQASNGNLYGMTKQGGSSDMGVIFEYDCNLNIYNKRIDLSSTLGINPMGSLMLSSGGKLYGLTNVGGTVNKGVIFEYDYSTNSYTKRVDLSSSFGSFPYGSLIQVSSGKLYGMTPYGGPSGDNSFDGVIFEYDYGTNTYTKKVDLNSALGFNPYGSLIQASNGKLYGMTRQGGMSNMGVIFEYDYATNTYIKKIDLSGSLGSFPRGSLVLASNGKLYGMTYQGGASDEGVIFEYNYTTNTYTKKIDLSTALGRYPNGSLIQASSGKLYGMTFFGGSSNQGVIFEYDYVTNTYTKKVDLSTSIGSHPEGSLVQASNAKLYGMTKQGGSSDMGVIFEYDYTSNTYTRKIDLTTSMGSNPQGSLMQASNGKLYGFTSMGGASDEGVIFEYDYVYNTYIKKYDFTGGPDGANPHYGHLIEIAVVGNALTTGGLASPHCAGITLSVPFTSTGTYNAGNVFTAQLSDASGSFTSPVNMGTLPGTTGSNISAIIPPGTPAGSGYRIRVVSSNPPATGTDNGTDITINTGPQLVCPSNITANNAAGSCGAIVNFAVSATGTPSSAFTYSHATGSIFPMGTTTVTVNATNSCGTEACAFDVVVVDVTAPTIACPADIGVNNDPGICGAVVTYSLPVASDNCPTGLGPVTLHLGLVSGSLFPVGTTTNTYKVTDGAGATTYCSFDVTVTDNETPIFTGVPANFSACNPISWIPPVGNDNCSVVVTSTHTSPHNFPLGTTTVTYTALDAASQMTSVSFDVTVLPSSVGADHISSNRTYHNICVGENITLTVNGGMLGNLADWQWYAGGCGNGISIGSGPAITVSPSTTTTYYARAEGFCNMSACAFLTVVVNTNPPNVAPIFTAVPSYGAPGMISTITVNPVPGATYYQWFTQNGQINGLLFNSLLSPMQTVLPSVDVNYVIPQQHYQVRVFAGNACGRTPQTNTVIRGTIAAPTCINGPIQVCPGSPVNYDACTPASPGNSPISYQWSLIPASAGTIIGNGNLGISITFNTGFNTAQLCVATVSTFGLVGQDYCITVTTSAPAPGPITGSLVPCENSSENYSIAALPNPNVTGYLWSTNITGATIGGIGTTATVNYPNNAFAGDVCVVATTGNCGNSIPVCLAVASFVPGNPGAIVGPTLGVCNTSNVNYEVTPGAINYSWNLPAGVTPTGLSNLSSINLNFGAAFTDGTIMVTAYYGCGFSNASLFVSGVPPAPTITPADICTTQVDVIYTASAVSATSFDWTLTNAFGHYCDNANCSEYLVNGWLAGGSMNVTSTNSCGTSVPTNLYENCRLSGNETIATNIYPNPTYGRVILEFVTAKAGTMLIRLTDLTGHTMFTREEKVVAGINRILMDLSTYGTGLYMIYLTDADGIRPVNIISVE